MRADVGKPRLDLGNAMRVVRGLGLGEQFGALAVGGEHHVDQPLRAARRLLREAPDARARRQLDRAVLERQFVRDRAEQRGLADAVAADQPDARAGRDAHRRAVEQQAPGDADRDIIENEHAAFL